MKSFKNVVVAALFVVAGSSFAQGWKTSDWTATVVLDEGSATNNLGKTLEIDLQDNGSLVATFKTVDGSTEEWTFTDTTYTWKDITADNKTENDIAVTSTKLGSSADVKVAGLVGKEGVTDTATFFANPTCKPLSADGDCTLPNNITWGFNTVGGKHYFFYGYTKGDNTSRVIIFKQK